MEDRKRLRDSPPPSANKAQKIGDTDTLKNPLQKQEKTSIGDNTSANDIPPPCAIGAHPTPLANRGRKPPQIARTDCSSRRSLNPLNVGEIGAPSAANGVYTTPAQSQDPRITRLQASSKLQDKSLSPIPVAGMFGRAHNRMTHLSDDRRSMQTQRGLETGLMANRLQIQSVGSKLRGKKAEFEKCHAQFEKFPEFRKKRENEIKVLQEELDQLNRARQKLESDTATERNRFSYAIASPRDELRAQDNMCNPQELSSVWQDMKALQDEVKTLKDILNARNDEWSRRTKTLEDGLANQQNVINDVTASKILELALALEKGVQNTETELLQTMEEHSASTTSEIDKLRHCRAYKL